MGDNKKTLRVWESQLIIYLYINIYYEIQK